VVSFCQNIRLSRRGYSAPYDSNRYQSPIHIVLQPSNPHLCLDSLILQQSSSYLVQGGTELLCEPRASVCPAMEYTQRWYMQALTPHTHVPRWYLHITATTWNISKHPQSSDYTVFYRSTNQCAASRPRRYALSLAVSAPLWVVISHTRCQVEQKS